MRDDDAGDVNSTWCERFDRFTAATLRLDDAGDENADDALADVQAEIDKLAGSA